MDQNQMETTNQLTPQERIEALDNVLDRLADLPGGRVKCGLIWVANELLDGLKKDLIALQALLGTQASDNSQSKDEANEEGSDAEIH